MNQKSAAVFLTIMNDHPPHPFNDDKTTMKCRQNKPMKAVLLFASVLAFFEL